MSDTCYAAERARSVPHDGRQNPAESEVPHIATTERGVDCYSGLLINCSSSKQ
jgi:hypothetical protein